MIRYSLNSNNNNINQFYSKFSADLAPPIVLNPVQLYYMYMYVCGPKTFIC